MIRGGEGILLNKGILQHKNLIYLLSILTLWLTIHAITIQGQKRATPFFIFAASCVLVTLKTKSLLILYSFFELSVVPVCLLILFFGYQPEKLQACLFIVIYTVVGRLPLLLYIIYSPLKFQSAEILTLALTLGFMVKTPMYLLHIWLPKAHVEAPVGGSIILAGILLKLGSYGLVVFLPFVKMNWTMSFYLTIRLLGSVISSILCVRRGDIKMLIAYSSVVHIGTVSIGLISGTELGYSCGVLMIVGHGISSPFLFAMAYWLYLSSHSRLLLYNITTWPLLMALIFSLVTLNISIPPRLCLWSEVFLALVLIYLSSRLGPLLIVILFLGLLYNLHLYVTCVHAKTRLNVKYFVHSSVFATMQAVVLSYASLFCLDIFHIWKI